MRFHTISWYEAVERKGLLAPLAHLAQEQDTSAVGTIKSDPYNKFIYYISIYEL